MSHIFISHVEADADVALAIALGLEQEGFETWCYEVDSIPGVSYLVQTGQAIQSSSAIVLIISPDSLGSNQVTTEVVRAHESRKPFVPVRRDITHVEFQARQPEWREAIGAATSIGIPSRGVAEVLPRIADGLGALGVHPQQSADPVRVAELRRTLDELNLSEKAGLASGGTLEGSAAVGPMVKKGPRIPPPVRKGLELGVVVRWGGHPVVRLAAVFLAVAGVVALSVFLVGRPFGGGDGAVVVAPISSPAAATRLHGEVVIKATASAIGGLGGRIHGMAWDGTDLWLTTDTDLFKMDTSGKVLGSYSVPNVTPEGLTWDGKSFWLFTTNWGYIYQFSLEESGGVLKPRVISSFPAPNQRSGGGVYDGLAWDGASLWYSDSFNVYRLDAAGNVLSSFAFDHQIAGLAWDGERLWLAYNPSGSGGNAAFMMIDAEGNTLLTYSGELSRIDALTGGDGHLWAAGKQSSSTGDSQQMIWQIDLVTAVIAVGPTATQTVRTLTATPTAESTAIELTATAAPTVAESEATTWRGTTSQGRTVEFDVIEGGGAISRIGIDVEGECPLPTGGAGPQPTGCTCEVKTETNMTKPWPIAETGFSYAPGDFEFSAVFDSPTTAHGFVRVHSSGTAGQSACSSDQVTWTASPQ